MLSRSPQAVDFIPKLPLPYFSVCGVFLLLSFLAAIPVSSAVAPSPFLDSEKFSFDQPLECPRQPRRTVPRIEESAQTAAIYEYRADRQSLSLHHVLYFSLPCHNTKIQKEVWHVSL